MMSSPVARGFAKLYTRGRCFSYYAPTLVSRRVGEAGTGGRSSEQDLKVAVFGASGVLGGYLCAELGTIN